MTADIGAIKELLAAREGLVAASLHNQEGGLATCARLTAATDDVLMSAFELLPAQGYHDLADKIAVLALGGYGRAELCPASDVDLMILTSPGHPADRLNQAATDFLHILWDAGLNVGHSVRSVEEALAMHGHTFDVWTSMLECRYVCGNAELADGFREVLTHHRTGTGIDRWLIEGVVGDIRKRHERYGQSVKLLEPNIKKSAGGLRDLHSIFWLFRGTDNGYSFPISQELPASRQFLDTLQAARQIETEEYSAALAAVEFLLRTRHVMHHLRHSLHDTLEYALQLEVAEALGYAADAELRPVEVFMREYYRHARTIDRLNRRLCERFRAQLDVPQERPGKTERISSQFIVRDGVLCLDPSTERLPGVGGVFEAFAIAAERGFDLDFRLRAAIERGARSMTSDDTRSAEHAALFRRVLKSRHVAPTLRAMNELDVLGKFIPEFGELVAFFQHNVYHYFTADEHTLIAVEHAERLREEHGILHDVFRNLRRKDILYLAVLFHDIAKPRGVADHEITGVAMAADILARIGMEDVIPTVSFLIRNHLLMEQVAFRRNIHDSETIREFAARFERPELLDYLYLLTYADLSAVNINVWTEWKSAMLQELYRRTSEVLRLNLHGEQIDAYHKSEREATAAGVVDRLSTGLPRAHVERHLQGIRSDAYLSQFDEEEIGRHIRLGGSGEPVSTIVAHGEGYTEITLIGRDAPFALSRFCAVLSANDADILDANVFTRDDGIIIDRFRVVDAATRHQLDAAVCGKIAEDAKAVATGMLDIAHLLAAHARRWKRRARLPRNRNVRTEVQFEDTLRYTIIDVFAPDSFGFLYRVTETMSKLGVVIHSAKIATRVDGIVDAFYVLDGSGTKIADPAVQGKIRGAILETIQALQEQELA